MSPFNLLLPSWWFAAYLGVVVLCPALVLVFTMVKLRGKRWRMTARRPIPPAKISEELLRFSQPWIGRLGFLGFPLQECTEDEGLEEISWRMANPVTKALAILEGKASADGSSPRFKLTLMSFLSDGRVIATADRPYAPQLPQHWQLSYRNFPTIEAQVQTHQASVEAAQGTATPILPAPQQLSIRLADEEQAVLDAMAASGDYLPNGETSPALQASTARLPKLAIREFLLLFNGGVSGRRRDIATVVKGKGKNDDDDMALSGATGPSVEELVERDIRRFRDLTKSASNNTYRAKKLGILIATVIVVVAALGRDSIPLTILKVLTILAVHEFGHWIMMKAFGFTGMGRYFVPFFGPTDLGRKLQAPAWQHLVVILAGPVPGLFLGLLCLVAGFFFPIMPAAILNIAALAVVMNSFYLLPFLPLDGGRVVDLLLFRDLPIFRPFFTGVSALATLIASFTVKSRVLRYIALGMFGGLAWDFKMIKVVRGGRKLGWAGGVEDETEALRKIFTGVRQEKNDAFLRSHDWFRQIDVLLGEVLRKKPKMITRFFGGGFYAVTSLLPLALVVGLATLVFMSGIHGMSKYAEASREFSESYPHRTSTLSEDRIEPFENLAATTADLMPEDDNGLVLPAAKRQELSGKANALAASLDKINWADAGQVNQEYLIEDSHLSIWMEVLCGRMEAATREGRLTEAARRAEVMLHAVSSLEPPRNQDQRELFRDAEMRALASVETLAASGKLDAATLSRIESRINQLNKAPLPEVENLLLVEGWASQHMERSLGLGDTREEVPSPASANSPEWLWKESYRQIRSALHGGLFESHATPATVALARHWKKSRKVGEIPAEMTEHPSLALGEADYIAAFCEGHRLATWRRLTALSALRLEAYRQKSGKLPETWEYPLAGGATLSLVRENGPRLKLVDQRNGTQKALPPWLGGGSLQGASLNHVCPLHGAEAPELSRK
ncbi:hypothetical protein [Luteolibacter luteus]|uniref:Site-2 protease family protein n=1 Tax=Luteolibacter luteus TaxID=2728835 RepID=A0A858RNM7_9BACT|nr:hypothetical protein [Luteolibacter luteus]QJE98335.1 hypothetical protein HHL09_21970 [Luteolibacter luteus]